MYYCTIKVFLFQCEIYRKIDKHRDRDKHRERDRERQRESVCVLKIYSQIGRKGEK